MGNKPGAGRPPKYNKDFHPQLVLALAESGKTDEQIAERLGIATSTLYNWYKNYPEILEAKKTGMSGPDDLVEKSLFEMATGYSYETQKALVVADGAGMGSHVEHVEVKETIPPNTTAMIFWLKNRRPQDWRDKQELEHSGGVDIQIEFIDAEKNTSD